MTSKGSEALEGIDLLIVLDISDVKRLGNLTESVRALTVPKLVIDHHMASDDPAGHARCDATRRRARPVSWCTTSRRCWSGRSRRRSRVRSNAAMLTDTGGFRFSKPRRAVSPSRAAARAWRRSRGDVHADLRVGAGGTRAPDGRRSRDAPGGRGAGLTWLRCSPTRSRSTRVKGGRSRRHRRARAVDRGNAHGVVLPRPGTWQGEGVVPQHRRNGRECLSRQFGGGGHAKASGAMVAGELSAVRDQVVEAAECSGWRSQSR